MDRYIVGRGGDTGSSTATATEDPNTLRSKSYAHIIDLLGEGQWEEVCVGGLKGLYLDEVPVMNADGTTNYEGITLDTRDGQINQTRLNTAVGVSSTTAVGIEMKYNFPVEKQVSGTSVDSMRVVVAVPRLTSQDASTGDLHGTSVQYKIEYKPSDRENWTVVPTQGEKLAYTDITYTGGTVTGFDQYTVYAYVSPATYYDNNQYSAPCNYSIDYQLNSGAWIVAKQGIALRPEEMSVVIDTVPGNIVGLRVVTSPASNFTPTGSLITALYGQVRSVRGGTYESDDGVQTLSGKTTSAYEREHSFKVTGASPFIVRCTRITPDSTSETLSNKTSFQSVSVVTDERFIYPCSVLAGVSVDATQFSSIPSRGYMCKMTRVKVPSNYDPITRVYSGFWDGSFKIAWTDNPAWCFRDLITNTRYGLGERIPESYIDDAALYEIAQYCDEYVPAGDGTYEPRFTCNVYLNTREEAYKVINNMAAVFRGITYWSSGSIVPVQDRPRDAVYAFTNANVADGVFTYQSSNIQTRYNAVTVSYNNPDDMYAATPEYVSDDYVIADTGYVNSTDITAFGCSSRSMARRVAKWLLYTNSYETDVVSFTTSLEGNIPMPGDVIKVVDSLRSTSRMGGRVVSATTSQVTLDAEIDFTALHSGTISVVSVDGELMDAPFTTSLVTDVLDLDTPFPKAVAKNSVFVIAAGEIPASLFRVLAVTEKDRTTFEINAVTYNPDKYDMIESDARLTELSTAVTYVNPVAGVTATEILYSDGVSIKSKLRLDWAVPSKAVAYNLYIIAPDGQRIQSTAQRELFYEVLDTIVGEYKITITATDILGHKSQPCESTVSVLGKTAPPTAVQGLSIKAMSGQGIVTWDLHSDLDVRVGGSIVIKHTTKIDGVQWEDGVVVATVGGNTTQAAVPLLPGTFTAKAVDDGDRYSTVFASALSSFAALEGINVMATLTESPTFSGSKVNLYVDDNVLTLYPEKTWDDIVSVDALP